jgi:large conductance mechanosensitive channel
MVTRFREFINRGNLIQLAVAFIMGVAFAAVIQSLVNDVIMPAVGLATGGVDFNSHFAVLKQGATAGPYHTVAQAHEAGAVTLNWGTFINTIFIFVIVAFVLFLIVDTYMRMQVRMQKQAPAAEAVTKDCPYCYTSIPKPATRCPNCTSQLTGSGS